MTRMPPRTTLKDLARRAGVSTSTASLVMRDSPLVAEATRRRVLKMARALGYVRNRSAANLRTRRSHTIGLVVCDITNPFYAEFTAGIEAACERDGWVTFLGNSAESLERQEIFLRRMHEQGVEGIIISPAECTSPVTIRKLHEAGLPCVQALRYLRGFTHDFAGVDSRLGVALATEHLIALGHRRIAFIGGGGKTSATRDRTAGYVDAMRRHGLAPHRNLIVRTAISRDAGASAINVLLDSEAPPTAAICYADIIALGVMWALHERGLRPGRDFAVVGHDNISEAGWSRPALTTVSVSPRQIGEEAVQLLFRRIAEPNKLPERVLLPPRLIVRDSCGTARQKVGAA
ncbi:MAG: LacI family DNA-binding transcriptional regulator [Rhodospirillales bacterium]|nr:LacI family DNA-binding transcriptional regulator [Rhodospirillales bacterium]